jgi:hypothetical protein
MTVSAFFSRVAKTGSGIDWNDFRLKLWHTSLLLAAAYAASQPQWAWAIPALTGAASMSQAPFKSA